MVPVQIWEIVEIVVKLTQVKLVEQVEKILYIFFQNVPYILSMNIYYKGCFVVICLSVIRFIVGILT